MIMRNLKLSTIFCLVLTMLFMVSCGSGKGEVVTESNNSINSIDEPGVYNKDVAGDFSVNTSEVTLKSMVIGGNLTISEEVGQGNVTLENVTVKGMTLISGGGENSVVLSDCDLSQLVIDKADGKIRVKADNNTKVHMTIVKSGVILENTSSVQAFGEIQIDPEKINQSVKLRGTFGNVNILRDTAEIFLEAGTIDKLLVEQAASNTVIHSAMGQEIKVLQASEDVEIKGDAKIALRELPGSSGPMGNIERKKAPAFSVDGGTGVEGRDLVLNVTDAYEGWHQSVANIRIIGFFEYDITVSASDADISSTNIKLPASLFPYVYDDYKIYISSPEFNEVVVPVSIKEDKNVFPKVVKAEVVEFGRAEDATPAWAGPNRLKIYFQISKPCKFLRGICDDSFRAPITPKSALEFKSITQSGTLFHSCTEVDITFFTGAQGMVLTPGKEYTYYYAIEYEGKLSELMSMKLVAPDDVGVTEGEHKH